MKKESYGLSILWTAALMLGALSLSVAVPLLWRGFFYLHIHPLKLPEITGLTVEQIREAYDEMMDFCMKGTPFGCGVLGWSEAGKAHFEDCAVLFNLDITVLKISAFVLAMLAIAQNLGYRYKKAAGRTPYFWAGTLLGGGFLVIALLAASDFDRAFVIFHHLFFPGKTNWLFDYDVDQIINILPEVFFRNASILIVGLLFLQCGLCIAADLRLRRSEKKGT